MSSATPVIRRTAFTSVKPNMPRNVGVKQTIQANFVINAAPYSPSKQTNVSKVEEANLFKIDAAPYSPKPKAFALKAQPFVSKKQVTYSIEELIQLREKSKPFMLPFDVKAALSEKSAAPYMTPCKTSTMKETDPTRLSQRAKQIGFGKSSDGYKHYIDLIPKNERSREDPMTPEVDQVCSKRSWDGQVTKWRRMLHAFDDIENKSQLNEVRKKLVVIYATPNKSKVSQTEPVLRSRVSHIQNYIPRSLTFDDN